MFSPRKWDPKMLMQEAASFYGEASQVQRDCDVPGLYDKLIANQQQGDLAWFPNIGLSHDVKCPGPQTIVLIRIILPFVAEQI